MINGNIEGLSKQILLRLESIYDMPVERENFLSEEIVLILCEITGITNREISIYLNRRGEVMDISVGEAGQVSLPSMNLRRSTVRLVVFAVFILIPAGMGNYPVWILIR